MKNDYLKVQQIGKVYYLIWNISFHTFTYYSESPTRFTHARE